MGNVMAQTTTSTSRPSTKGDTISSVIDVTIAYGTAAIAVSSFIIGMVQLDPEFIAAGVGWMLMAFVWDAVAGQGDHDQH
jgi:hypothetical protein